MTKYFGVQCKNPKGDKHVIALEVCRMPNAKLGDRVPTGIMPLTVTCKTCKHADSYSNSEGFFFDEKDGLLSDI